MQQQRAEKKPAIANAIAVYRLPAETLFVHHLAVQRRSRTEWMRIPFDMMPPYVECGLVFDWDARWIDEWSGYALFPSSELSEIVLDQFKYRRSVDGPTRAKLAKRMRRRWCGLVAHAIGYRVAGCERHEVLEFAKEARHE